LFTITNCSTPETIKAEEPNQELRNNNSLRDSISEQVQAHIKKIQSDTNALDRQDYDFNDSIEGSEVEKGILQLIEGNLGKSIGDVFYQTDSLIKAVAKDTF
jgi:hypothetical protein